MARLMGVNLIPAARPSGHRTAIMLGGLSVGVNEILRSYEDIFSPLTTSGWFTLQFISDFFEPLAGVNFTCYWHGISILLVITVSMGDSAQWL